MIRRSGADSSVETSTTETSLPVAVPSARQEPPRTNGRPAVTRNSPGLDQFFHEVRDQFGLSILDLGGASQANISFITNLGHRIYSEDLVHALHTGVGPENEELEPAQIDAFLDQTLNFSDEQFDGALVWDTFQYMPPALLGATVDRLARILRPKACLLAFFHADERSGSVPVYGYRIVDSKTLSLAHRGERKPAQYFNNRGLEKLFHRFQSVKFFLTRDHLREIIVKR